MCFAILVESSCLFSGLTLVYGLKRYMAGVRSCNPMLQVNVPDDALLMWKGRWRLHGVARPDGKHAGSVIGCEDSRLDIVDGGDVFGGEHFGGRSPCHQPSCT